MRNFCIVLFLCFLLPLLVPASSLVIRDTTRVFRLVELALEQHRNGSPDSSDYYFKQADALADKMNFENGKLHVVGNYSVFLYGQLRYSEALHYAEKALQISLRRHNNPRAAAAYNTIALQYQAQGKLKYAAQNLMLAIAISSKISQPVAKDLSDRRKYLNNLSSLFLDLNDIEKGRRYALQSLEIALQLKDTIAAGNSLINVMVAETLSGNLTDAEKYGKQYLTIGRSHGDIQMQIKALNNLADVYRRQKRYPMALDSYNKALAILPETLPGNKVYSLSGISTVFKEMGDIKRAEVYFEKAFLIAEQELGRTQLIDMYLAGAEIKEALGDYRKALAFRKEHERLNDSLRNQEAQQTIQELEVQYQTAQNKKTIAERDLKIVEQGAELDRKNKWIIIYIALITVLVLSFIFIRLIQMQKRKTASIEQKRKLLEAQLKGEEKERARTAKELHDGVASILSAAKLHINSIHQSTPVYSELNQLLEIAVQEIRNISHNLAPEMILQEGLAYAIRSFCHRINRSDIRIDCYLLGEIPSLRKNSQLLIYRIVQEAVTNILKHAEASEAIIQLVGEDDRLLITIEDNGKGFDFKQIQSQGIGFRNLHARVKMLRGDLDIRSVIGNGTSVFIEIDCSKNKKSKREKTSRHIATSS